MFSHACVIHLLCSIKRVGLQYSILKPFAFTQKIFFIKLLKDLRKDETNKNGAVDL